MRPESEVQADYALALSRMPDIDGALESFADALEREAHHLARDPSLLFQQLYNRLQWTSGGPREALQRERHARSSPWMHNLAAVHESPALRRTLAADGNCVCHVTAVPGSGLIVSAGFEAALKVWEPNTGELVGLLEGHNQAVELCEASPDGTLLVSLSRDRTVRVWELATGVMLHSMPGHDDDLVGAFRCEISPDSRFAVVAAAGGRGVLNVWDLVSGELITAFAGHTRQVRAWAVSPDAAAVVSGANDGSLLIWEPADGRVTARTAGHDHAVVAAAFSADGRSVVSADFESAKSVWDPSTREFVVSAVEQGAVKAWDASTGELLWSREGHGLTFASDGTLFVARGTRVDAVDADGEVIRTIEGMCDNLGGVTSGTVGTISPDGTLVVSAGADDDPAVWDTRSGRRLGDLVGHAGQVQNWVFTDDGRWIVTSCDDGAVRVWDPIRLGPDTALPAHLVVTETRVSPDGAVVVSAGRRGASGRPESGTVKLWSVGQGKLLRSLDAHTADEAYGARFGPDGEYLVTSGLHDVAFWSSDGSRLIGRYAQHLSLMAISGNGRWVVGSGWKGLTILDSAKAEPIATVPTDEQVIRFALTQDGHSALSGCRDGTVQIWNVADWSCRHAVAAHAKPVSHGLLQYHSINAIAVSPDSSCALSAGADASIRVWELSTGALIRSLQHTESVWDCAFTPDGTAIVFCTGDGSILVWDARTELPGRVLARAGAPASVCVVSPDGRLVITAHHDASVTAREIETGAVVASIRLTGWPSCFDLHPWRPFLTCGDQAGNVCLIEFVGLQYGPIIVTARESSGGLHVRCPACRQQHLINEGQLGAESLCPTPGCSLPLRVNAFVSKAAPPSLPEHLVPPEPGISAAMAPLEAHAFLDGSIWQTGSGDEKAQFHPDGRIVFTAEPTEGIWVVEGRGVHIERGELEMEIRIGSDGDRLNGGVRRLGDADGTWISFAWQRARS